MKTQMQEVVLMLESDSHVIQASVSLQRQGLGLRELYTQKLISLSLLGRGFSVLSPSHRLLFFVRFRVLAFNTRQKLCSLL